MRVPSFAAWPDGANLDRTAIASTAPRDTTAYATGMGGARSHVASEQKHKPPHLRAAVLLYTRGRPEHNLETSSRPYAQLHRIVLYASYASLVVQRLRRNQPSAVCFRWDSIYGAGSDPRPPTNLVQANPDQTDHSLFPTPSSPSRRQKAPRIRIRMRAPDQLCSHHGGGLNPSRGLSTPVG
jgi:hypothetical protein